MVRQTSLETYHEIKENGLLSKRRFQVYELLFKRGPLTGLQVIDYFRKNYINYSSTGNISTRLSELRDSGVVTELGTTACPISGRNVILWDVTKHLPKNFKKHRKINCPHCDGKGYLTEAEAQMELGL